VGEEHLDLPPLAPGDDVGVGLGDVAGEVPGALGRVDRRLGLGAIVSSIWEFT
jgi:hypothetical protein